jgi:hypothetical protein
MISSILKTAGLVLAGSMMVLLALGCQTVAPIPPDRVNETPIQLDEAMANRLWTPTKAIYPSFSSETGPCEVGLIPADNLDYTSNILSEGLLFLANTVILPGTMVLMPPWEQVETPAFYIPPSYTANPPLKAPADNPNDYSGRSGTDYTYSIGRTVHYDSN